MYLDSSAVLRLLEDDRGASELQGSVATSSALVEVETHRAIERARLAGDLDDLELARKRRELASLLDNLHLFPVSDEVIVGARAPSPIAISTMNAVHVATASVISNEGGEFEFWTYDPDQAAAALAAGHRVCGVDLEGA